MSSGLHSFAISSTQSRRCVFVVGWSFATTMEAPDLEVVLRLASGLPLREQLPRMWHVFVEVLGHPLQDECDARPAQDRAARARDMPRRRSRPRPDLAYRDIPRGVARRASRCTRRATG